MPHLAQILSSDTLQTSRRRILEYKRRLLKQPHQLEVFVSISDPYSYLLLQVLPELQKRFGLEISLFTVRDKQADMFPDASRWQTNSLVDANRLARLYNLAFPSSLPVFSAAAIDNTSAQLLALEHQPDALRLIGNIFETFWSNKAQKTNKHMDPSLLAQLEANQQYLQAQGHYLSAMIKYAGEWYWGLDRLDHLERRLYSQGLGVAKEEPKYDLQTRSFCNAIPNTNVNKQTLTMYFSARSPYSYLGLERAVKLCQHYQVPLHIKPVLPMMMRGLNVPQSKKMYIFHDTKREANKLGIAYGKVADPLGKAVENCYALFDYAKNQGRDKQYLLEFGRAVNSQGVHADSATGMRLVAERSGLDWKQAKQHLAQQNWRTAVEHNMLELNQLGLWGVPCFQYGDTIVWGQDRLWVIEQAICR